MLLGKSNEGLGEVRERGSFGWNVGEALCDECGMVGILVVDELSGWAMA